MKVLNMSLPEFYDILPEVRDAMAEHRPIVALESTIITHGMPFPQNLEMSRSVETLIRENGATPAVIAVLNGRIKIGLSEKQSEDLANERNALKVSRADLAYCVATGKTAGTTVAATMMIAQRANIKVFATGGIGGVHKGAETSFDISADLLELGRTGVIVVAAGPKAILDVPKTMEVLETQGVPVVGYQTDNMPLFWSRSSTIPVPLRLDSATDIARFQITREQMGIDAGMLIANPIPGESEIENAVIESYITEAQSELDSTDISGKEVTPFLLSKIVELSNGKSLESNIALVRNNARLAAEIARQFTG